MFILPAVTTQAAEAEKAAAGGGRNVEHMALHEEQNVKGKKAAAAPSKSRKSKRGAQQEQLGREAGAVLEAQDKKGKKRTRQK